MTVAALVAAAVLILSRWNVNYYALTPGDATPVASFIKVPPKLDHPLTGTILLTDVYVQQLTALTYLWQRYVSSDSQVSPRPRCSARPRRTSSPRRASWR